VDIQQNYSASTEEYDGSAWTGGGNLNTARDGLAGAGIQTAGLFGGYCNNNLQHRRIRRISLDSRWKFKYSKEFFSRMQEFKQRVWHLVDIQEQFTNSTEEYNGSAWTAGGNLNTARRSLAGCGTQTAALAFGGENNSSIFQQQKNIMELLGQILNFYVNS
jgi:hypothetical protein